MMETSITHCPSGHKYGVIDSRPVIIGGFHTIARKRKCPDCGHKTTSLELPTAVATDVLTYD